MQRYEKKPNRQAIRELFNEEKDSSLLSPLGCYSPETTFSVFSISCRVWLRLLGRGVFFDVVVGACFVGFEKKVEAYRKMFDAVLR